jgi:VWFA-related protein
MGDDSKEYAMSRGWWARLGAAGFTAAVLAQGQTFKTGVDLIAIDVQVVDRDGHPVKTLAPTDFQVTFNGKSHKVVSADLVDYTAAAGRAAGPGAPTLAPAAFASTPPSRLVLVVVDAGSFDVGDARGVAVAAQSFVDRLPADDRVGLFTYPMGPKVDPTSNHGLVKDQLDHVSGQHQPIGGRFKMTPGDIIDVQAGDSAVIARLVAQNCPGEPGCADRLKAEADGETMQFEAQAISSLQTLASVFDAMQRIEGRKIVVLVSGGEPTSDRTGGRPDIGDLPMQLGERAARADASVYTLFIDDNFLKQNSADQRLGRTKAGVSGLANVERDNTVLGRWLDQFSGASGGAFMRVLVGSGEGSYDRILQETSAYYRLGVEPAKEDRDGQSHPLKVKLVNQKNVTLRSRAWAIVPVATAATH